VKANRVKKYVMTPLEGAREVSKVRRGCRNDFWLKKFGGLGQEVVELRGYIELLVLKQEGCRRLMSGVASDDRSKP